MATLFPWFEDKMIKLPWGEPDPAAPLLKAYRARLKAGGKRREAIDAATEIFLDTDDGRGMRESEARTLVKRRLSQAIRRRRTMRRRMVLVGSIAAVVVVAGAAALTLALSGGEEPPVAADPLPALDPREVAAGEVVYRKHCSACHGFRLEVSPYWKDSMPDASSPPQPLGAEGEAWRHPRDLLVKLIRFGGETVPLNGEYSRMPGFRDILTDEEIGEALTYISTWWTPEQRRHHWQISEESRNSVKER